MTADEMLALARFQRLDSRNATEAAMTRLLGAMADEIERLRDCLKGIASCATCSACQGAASSALTRG